MVRLWAENIMVILVVVYVTDRAWRGAVLGRWLDGHFGCGECIGQILLPMRTQRGMVAEMLSTANPIVILLWFMLIEFVFHSMAWRDMVAAMLWTEDYMVILIVVDVRGCFCSSVWHCGEWLWKISFYFLIGHCGGWL